MDGAAHVHLDPATATGAANDQADAAPQRPGSLSSYAEDRMDPVSSSPDVKKSLVLQPRLLIRGILRVIQRTQ